MLNSVTWIYLRFVATKFDIQQIVYVFLFYTKTDENILKTIKRFLKTKMGILNPLNKTKIIFMSNIELQYKSVL